MLEPCGAKVSRTVLRGLGDRKVAQLLGKVSRPVLRGPGPSNGARLLGAASCRLFRKHGSRFHDQG
jgi:hypothetical protein